MGGVAGGEKYLVEGIFFKFAIDAFVRFFHNFFPGSHYRQGVYGGDDFAMKAAGHELNGLKAYFKTDTDGLHFPFMVFSPLSYCILFPWLILQVLISYLGFRLIATPKLPLGPGSLIYGSCDAGVTVARSVDEFNQLMAEVLFLLLLRYHIDKRRPSRLTPLAGR